MIPSSQPAITVALGSSAAPERELDLRSANHPTAENQMSRLRRDGTPRPQIRAPLPSRPAGAGAKRALQIAAGAIICDGRA